MKASELLEAAAGEIKQWGWTQHQRTDQDGRICAMKAIDSAGTMYFCNTLCASAQERLDAESQAYIFLGQAAGYDATSYPTWMWNDTEGRTQTEVLDAFAHAVKIAKEDEELNENK